MNEIGSTEIFIWDVSTGSCLKELDGGMTRIFSVAFCQGGSYVAGAGSSHDIQIFASNDGTYVGSLRGHRGGLNAVVSIDDTTLASCSEDGTIKLWDLTGWECSATFVVGRRVWCGAGCGQGRWFLSGSEDGMLRRWAVGSGLVEVATRAHQGAVRSVAVNAAEDTVATTGDDGAIRLWRLPELTPCASPYTLRPARPYEGMNLSGATGLTSAQREALTAMGAFTIPSV
jgi:WD40 repeat protein